MIKKVNKTLIGVFVTGAIALIVIAVLIFGSGKFFKKTHKYVMFFEGSVQGLNIGSPVIFKGVKVGSVTDIDLIVDPKDRTLRIPVFIELEPGRIKGVTQQFRRDPKAIQNAIDKGLRAQLQMQSFVTGQLMIGLDFLPDKPALYVGLVKEYQEIPTIPTALEELSKTLQELPLKEIFTKLDLTFEGIQKLVNSPKTKESIESLNHILKDTQKLVQHINEKIDPLMVSLTKTSDATYDTLVQAKSTMSTTKDTLKSTQDILKQAEKTLGTFSEDSRLVYELNRTLRELSAASRSVKFLSEYLERHPEALLKGKGSDKGD
ncbi:MAG: MlaD family protein [Nitrospirota bacterium]|nr:MlaD family protein [Nitrospirota bacterium]MDH5769180.1 MlaD family protein [Nitrospirota bacterium]